MISPHEQHLLRPAEPRQNRPNPLISPILIILACVVLPLILPYALTASDNEAQVAGVVVGLIAVCTVVAQPFWGLVLFIGLIYIRPEELIPQLEGMHFTLLVSMVTLIGTIVHHAISRTKVTRDPLNFMIIGFGVVVVMSTIFSKGNNTSEAAEDIAKLVIMVLLVLNLVRNPQNYRTFVTSLILFTCYLAGYAIYLYMTGQSLHVAEEGVDRAQATGIFSDPNDLAATIVAGLALTVGRLVGTKGSGWKFFYGLIGVLLFCAVITTNSRGGLLALMTVMGGSFIVFGKKKTLATVLAVIVGALVFFVAPARMSNMDDEEESANSRFMYWDNGFKMFAENPITGIGYRQFEDGNNGATAHNSFVLCFTELGLPGYFLWMGCLYYGFKRKKIEGLPELQSRDISASRLALAAFLTSAFWISRTYIAVLYVYIAIATVSYLSSLPPEQPKPVNEDPEDIGPFYADWGRIAMVAGSVMLLIKLMVERFA